MKHGQNTEKRKSLYNLLSVLNQCFIRETRRHSPCLLVSVSAALVRLNLSQFSHHVPLLEKRKIVALWPRTGYAEYPMSWTDLKDSPINSAELLRIPPQFGEPWQLHFPISLWRSNDRART